MEKPNRPSDVQLLSSLKAGDPGVFAEIYERYHHKVYAVALKILRQQQDAEEILQEVMVKLWLSAKSLKEESNLEAYLKTITRNLCYNLLRRQVLEAKTAIARGGDWRDFSNETEEQVLLQETKEVLRHAIDRLPARQKAVYQLCQQEGLRYEEAARRLNLSTHTVQGYMKQAIRSVRAYVTLHGDIAVVAVVIGILRK